MSVFQVVCVLEVGRRRWGWFLGVVFWTETAIAKHNFVSLFLPPPHSPQHHHTHTMTTPPDAALRTLLVGTSVADLARTTQGVVTLSPDASVEAALRTLASHKILSAPVVDSVRDEREGGRGGGGGGECRPNGATTRFNGPSKQNPPQPRTGGRDPGLPGCARRHHVASAEPAGRGEGGERRVEKEETATLSS